MAITTQQQFIDIWTELDALYGELSAAPNNNTGEPAVFGDYEDATAFSATTSLTTTLAEFSQFSSVLDGSGTTLGQAALAANLAFVELGNQYVAWLDAGNAPILGIAKPRGPNDPGQSYHDNILGNLSQPAVQDRFLAHLGIDVDATGDGVADLPVSPLSPLAETYLDRPLYNGNANDAADLANSIAWDIANGLDPAQLDLARGGANPVDGTVFVVPASGGAVTSFGTIQDAVNAASAGDTIVAGPGTYAESVSVTKALHFEGAGAGQTIVTPPSGNGFDINGDLGTDATVSISGFTFADSPNGAGVAYDDNAVLGSLEIADADFTGNFRNGVAIGGNNTAVDLDFVSIVDSTFTGNGGDGAAQTSSGDGDILFFQYGGDAELRQLTITGEVRGSGPAENGIQFRGDSGAIGAVTLEDVTVAGVYEKQPIAVFNYDNLDGLSGSNVQVTADSLDFQLAVNFSGIGGDFDFRDFGIDTTGAPDPAVLQGDGGANTISSGDEDAVLVGNGGEDRLNGRGGDDTLLGGADSDVLKGGSGNDTLDGGADADVLRGGKGDDLYLVDDLDTVRERSDQGIDTVQSFGDYRLPNHVEKLILMEIASNTETFDDFALGPIANDENGWKFAGTSDQEVVTDPDDAGNQVFRMSSDPSTGAFGGPYSPTLTATAGEPSTTADADSMQYTVTFKAVQPGDNSRLEVDFGIDAGTDRNNFMVIENTAEGIRIAVADPQLDGTWVTGDTLNDFTAFTGNTTLIEGVDASAEHELTAIVTYADGVDNDVIKYYLNGAFIGESTTFENFRVASGDDHDVAAELNQTSRVFFRNSAGGAPNDGPGGENQGFLFDDLTYSVFDSDGPDGTGNGLDNMITGTHGANTLKGRGGDDMLIGLAGDDILAGGSGDDTLDGGLGEDRLNGGDGDDTLTGGAEGDRFIARDDDNGTNTITDFEFDLDELILDGGKFIGANDTQIQGGIYAFGDGLVEVSVDGDDAIIRESRDGQDLTTVILEGQAGAVELPSPPVTLNFITIYGDAHTAGFQGQLIIENDTGAAQTLFDGDIDIDGFDFTSLWVEGATSTTNAATGTFSEANGFQTTFNPGDSLVVGFVATTDEDPFVDAANFFPTPQDQDTFEGLVQQAFDLDFTWGV